MNLSRLPSLLLILALVGLIGPLADTGRCQAQSAGTPAGSILIDEAEDLDEFEPAIDDSPAARQARRFAFVSLRKLKRPIFYRHKGEFRRIRIQEESMELLQPFDEGSHFTIFRRTKDKDKEGKPRFEPILEVDLPEGDAPFVIVYFDQRVGRIADRAAAYDLGLDDFPLGSVRMINATSRDLVMRVGDSFANVPSAGGKTVLFDLEAPARVTFQVGIREGDSGRVLYSSRYPLYPGVRLLFMAHVQPDPPPGLPPFQVLLFRDRGPI